MKYFFSIACIVVLTTLVEAQQSAPNTPPEKPSVAKSAPVKNVDPEIARRRLVAVSMPLMESDFDQAVNAARNFREESPRALVTIGIARATLENKRNRQVR
jgi:hypothetical protein